MSQPRDRATSQKQVVVVSLPAELDVGAEPAAMADLLAAIATGHPVVVVDMTDTTFIDSAGARALYRAEREGASRGTAIRFAISHRTVLRNLDIMGYTHVLAIYPSRAAAVSGQGTTGGKTSA